MSAARLDAAIKLLRDEDSSVDAAVLKAGLLGFLAENADDDVIKAAIKDMNDYQKRQWSDREERMRMAG